MTGGPDTTIVVPTVGRASLDALLTSLGHAEGSTPDVVVVDDRRSGPPLVPAQPFVRVVRSGGRGPAAARNRGCREARTTWISFLDDDVVVETDWLQALGRDLDEAADDVVAVQGRVRVPLPDDRRPRDAERGTAGLERAQWITADMTVRRSALRAVGGFDERFRRAYREDADLGLRLSRVGRIVLGDRRVVHPVRDDGDWFSVRQQRGNADDVLMRRLHGPGWRQAAGAPRGALSRHRLTVAAAVVAAVCALRGRRRAAVAAGTVWASMTGLFAWLRIAPGPRDAVEVRRMLLTSTVIPFAAVRSWLHGLRTHRTEMPRNRLPDAVLFDRDGTLVHDIPYNRHAHLVAPVDDVRRSLERLRRAGVRIGVVSNQSGVARGLITPDELEAVDARVDQLLGPFDTWQVCVHGPADSCDCRKPRPGMVLQACDELGVDPSRVVVVGDIGADVEAATAAGASSVLVPTPHTRHAEVAVSSRVQPTIAAAVRSILRGDW